MSLKENISVRLKEIMNIRGFRQIDVLNLSIPYCEQYNIKMNKSDISQYCAGKNEPTPKKLFILSCVLNVNEKWLMGFDVPMEDNTETNSQIGKRIRSRREELGITQEELAVRLGYKSKTTIAKIENGTNDIVQSKVTIFAEALNTSVSYLMNIPKIQATIDSYEHSLIYESSKLNPKGKQKILSIIQEMACNPLYNDNYLQSIASYQQKQTLKEDNTMNMKRRCT